MRKTALLLILLMAFAAQATIYMRTITIPAAKFSDTVPEFVYHLDIASLDSQFTDASRSDGLDIVVQDSLGDTLPKEIVAYTQGAGTTASGQYYWCFHGSNHHNNLFKISTGSAVAHANSTATWTNSNFISVHHFEEASGTFADATGNYSATGTGASYGVTGQLGKAMGLSDVADYVSLPEITQMNGASQWTWSFLFKCTGDAWNSVFLFARSDVLYELPGASGGVILANQCGAVNWNTGFTPAICTDGNYHLMTVVYDGTQSNNNYRWLTYIDKTNWAGSIAGTLPTTLSTQHIPFLIGYSGSAYSKVGDFDEFRQCSRAYTTAEINAYSDNLSSPSTFYSITTGPTNLSINDMGPYQTFQRHGTTGTIKVSGTITGSTIGNRIEAAILNYNTKAVVQAWTRIDSTTHDTTYSGSISGIATGGPYLVAVRRCSVVDTGYDTAVSRCQVGDLVFYFGQSNAYGIGNCQNNARDTAQCDSAGAFSSVTHLWKKCADPGIGFWAEIAPRFCEKYVHTYHVPIGFINMGVSSQTLCGTDSANAWGLHNTNVASVCRYAWAYNIINLATQGQMKDTITIWYQGESDAGAYSDSLYEAKFDSLKNWFRTDFGGKVILGVQIGRRTDGGGTDTGWAEFRNLQYRLFNNYSGDADVVFGACTYDLPLVDIVHLQWMGQDSLANRLFLSYQAYMTGTKYTQPVITGAFKRGLHTVELDFNKNLAANTSPSGLTLLKFGTGIDTLHITGTSISTNKLTLTTEDSSGHIQYRYAYGMAPMVTAPLYTTTDGSPMVPNYGAVTPQCLLTVAAGTGGTVSPTGAQFLDSGATFAIAATPAAHYAFTSWSVSEGAHVTSSTSASTTAWMTAAGTITANFGYATPTAPTKIYPADGATSISKNVTFRWNSVAADSFYIIDIDTSVGFASALHTSDTLTDTVKSKTLTKDTTNYRWRVRGNNGGGALSGSTIISFKTGTAASSGGGGMRRRIGIPSIRIGTSSLHF